ncbi:17593_t:CDS:2, partial [Racocetra persica]
LAQNMYRCERSLLVLDSFRDHITELVKKNFSKNMTNMAVIPSSLTTNKVHELTPSKRIKQLSYSLMAICCGISSNQDVNTDQQYEIETEDYIDKLANNIKLIDLTNEEPV